MLAYPGFYQGQLIVVRGTLVTRDQPVLLSPTIERSIPLIFRGPSPIDGPVELRASFWDVGRLSREDPRIATLGLDRLVPKAGEGDWPRPGVVIALTVTDAMGVKPPEGSPSLRDIALDPSPYVGQRVRVTGQFRGRNLYGDAAQAPSLSQWDFVLRSADAAVWITGLRPRGKGFNLDIDAIASNYAIAFDHYFHDELVELEGLARDGLVVLGRQRISVTPRGRLLMRNVSMVSRQAQQQARYSKVI